MIFFKFDNSIAAESKEDVEIMLGWVTDQMIACTNKISNNEITATEYLHTIDKNLGIGLGLLEALKAYEDKEVDNNATDHH